MAYFTVLGRLAIDRDVAVAEDSTTCVGVVTKTEFAGPCNNERAEKSSGCNEELHYSCWSLVRWCSRYEKVIFSDGGELTRIGRMKRVVILFDRSSKR